MKTLILGVGNILQKDDGIGVRVAELLKERFEIRDDVSIIDGGTMGLDLLPFIDGYDNLLIIDAVKTGGEPGTIVKIEGDDIPRFLSTKISVHQIGFPDMLSAATMMDIMPGKICLIGIQPENIESGIELSGSVEKRMGDIINTVLEKLEQWGIKSEQKEIL